jgi:transaldolase
MNGHEVDMLPKVNRAEGIRKFASDIGKLEKSSARKIN